MSIINMPINASIFYVKAEQEYQDAETTQQKLKGLKKMLATAPNHKGAEKLRKEIKTRIAKLKYKCEKEAQQSKAGGHSISIKKEGAAQIAFVSLPNAGKSYILEKLSGAPVEQENYPFTTKVPAVRMIDIEGAKLQGIEVPAIYRDFYDKDNGPEIFSIIRNADFIVLIIDGRKPVDAQIEELAKEFEKADITLTRDRHAQRDFMMFIPAVVLVNRNPYYVTRLLNLDVLNFKELKPVKLVEALWKHLRLIRVYTKADGKVAKKPVVMKQKSTVGELAKKVHKDFVKNFKYAKIWGSGVFPGQQVGMEYVLKDKDVVELYTN